ncbi:MAG: hypothetical protein D6712_13790 [Chloroflexi bacterium]|nr:MAG: hypothetical protein D6712_13790 [Chloroflexota bacterium]
MPCREHALQLQRYDDTLKSHGVQPLYISFSAKAHFLRAWREQTGVTNPLLVDTEREVYRAYRMKRGNIWRVYGPKTLWYYALAMFGRGQKWRGILDDAYQLGGDCLIDQRGIVHYIHRSEDPTDRPTIDTLLQAIPT